MVTVANSVICTMNSNYIMAANIVFPRDMVCFRCIIVNTLHKGDEVCSLPAVDGWAQHSSVYSSTFPVTLFSNI